MLQMIIIIAADPTTHRDGSSEEPRNTFAGQWASTRIAVYPTRTAISTGRLMHLSRHAVGFCVRRGFCAANERKGHDWRNGLALAYGGFSIKVVGERQ